MENRSLNENEDFATFAAEIVQSNYEIKRLSKDSILTQVEFTGGHLTTLLIEYTETQCGIEVTISLSYNCSEPSPEVRRELLELINLLNEGADGVLLGLWSFPGSPPHQTNLVGRSTCIIPDEIAVDAEMVEIGINDVALGIGTHLDIIAGVAYGEMSACNACSSLILKDALGSA